MDPMTGATDGIAEGVLLGTCVGVPEAVCVGIGVAPRTGASVGGEVGVGAFDGVAEGVLLDDSEGSLVGSGTMAPGLDEAGIGIVGSLVGKPEGETLGSQDGTRRI